MWLPWLNRYYGVWILTELSYAFMWWLPHVWNNFIFSMASLNHDWFNFDFLCGFYIMTTPCLKCYCQIFYLSDHAQWTRFDFEMPSRHYEERLSSRIKSGARICTHFSWRNNVNFVLKFHMLKGKMWLHNMLCKFFFFLISFYPFLYFIRSAMNAVPIYKIRSSFRSKSIQDVEHFVQDLIEVSWVQWGVRVPISFNVHCCS